MVRHSDRPALVIHPHQSHQPAGGITEQNPGLPFVVGPQLKQSLAVAGVGPAGDCLPQSLEDCDRMDSYAGILSEMECLGPDDMTDTHRATQKELMEAVCDANQPSEPVEREPLADFCTEEGLPPRLSPQKRGVVNHTIALMLNFSVPYLEALRGAMERRLLARMGKGGEN